ncbi:RluA family pseudouridine synthase [Geoalkalibacter subterraneus]|uniref:Pseudouridine synthase RsuA/RluA-like domain-containing protein n=1 Tax=Geoalkalibacter subterraneus TaxID=483547 RepID=A0A0B5FU05_9BACT|nr:RluA family pseudouridine synthase [Geoalkalibacter subterraneus]AJF07076.1 hypothetical protein GSUB_11605 [Geoalkalibacter subterraneus]
MNEMIVTDEEAGMLAERFLQARIPAAPLSYLRKLLKSGKIRDPQGPLSMTKPLASGDRIFLPDSARLRELRNASEQRSPSIIYETPNILIVDKPAGLATHAGEGHDEDNLTDRIWQCMKDQGERFRVAPIQRLDLETSGLTMFGKGKKSCSVLGQMMMTQPVTKTYLALVSGKMDESGILVSEIPAKGKLKKAETAYQCLAANSRASFLRIVLRTGRQHQIRRQFKDIGHPLFGDKRYQGPKADGLNRLFLHCGQLEFTDPFSHEPVSIRSELPAELNRALKKFGLTI